MNKYFIRLVSLFLIPCLLADPATASGLSAAGELRPGVSSPTRDAFEQQALSVRSGWVGANTWRRISAWIQHRFRDLQFPGLEAAADGVPGTIFLRSSDQLGGNLEDEAQPPGPRYSAERDHAGQSDHLKVPLDRLDLPVRSYNALQDMDLMTVGDLVRKTRSEILGSGPSGAGTLLDTLAALSKYDPTLQLAPEKAASGAIVQANFTASSDLASRPAPPKEPWQMTHEEFEELASHGIVAPYKTDAAAIDAVIRGEKPIAEVDRVNAEQALRMGLDVKQISRSGRREPDYFVYRPGNEAAFGRLEAVLNRTQDRARSFPGNEAAATLLMHIELGRAFGYSEPDIMAFMNRNYGHKKIVQAALNDGKTVPSEVLANYTDLFSKGRPLTNAELAVQNIQTLVGESLALIPHVNMSGLEELNFGDLEFDGHYKRRQAEFIVPLLQANQRVLQVFSAIVNLAGPDIPSVMRSVEEDLQKLEPWAKAMWILSGLCRLGYSGILRPWLEPRPAHISLAQWMWHVARQSFYEYWVTTAWPTAVPGSMALREICEIAIRSIQHDPWNDLTLPAEKQVEGLSTIKPMSPQLLTNHRALTRLVELLTTYRKGRTYADPEFAQFHQTLYSLLQIARRELHPRLQVPEARELSYYAELKEDLDGEMERLQDLLSFMDQDISDRRTTFLLRDAIREAFDSVFPPEYLSAWQEFGALVRVHLAGFDTNPIELNGDRRKILSIFRNLFMNSREIWRQRCGFDEGSAGPYLPLEIAVTVQSRVKAGTEEIEVSDNAGGIHNPGLLEEVEPGRQRALQLNTTERGGGSGLGLAHVWHLVHIHDKPDIKGAVKLENINDAGGHPSGLKVTLTLANPPSSRGSPDVGATGHSSASEPAAPIPRNKTKERLSVDVKHATASEESTAHRHNSIDTAADQIATGLSSALLGYRIDLRPGPDVFIGWPDRENRWRLSVDGERHRFGPEAKISIRHNRGKIVGEVKSSGDLLLVFPGNRTVLLPIRKADPIQCHRITAEPIGFQAKPGKDGLIVGAVKLKGGIVSHFPPPLRGWVTGASPASLSIVLSEVFFVNSLLPDGTKMNLTNLGFFTGLLEAMRVSVGQTLRLCLYNVTEAQSVELLWDCVCNLVEARGWRVKPAAFLKPRPQVSLFVIQAEAISKLLRTLRKMLSNEEFEILRSAMNRAIQDSHLVRAAAQAGFQNARLGSDIYHHQAPITIHLTAPRPGGTNKSSTANQSATASRSSDQIVSENSSAVLTRPAGNEDLESVRRIRDEVFLPSIGDATPLPTSIEYLSHLLEITAQGAVDGLFVAEQAGEIVGYAAATVYTRNHSGFLHEIAVLPSFREAGVGTRIIDYVRDWVGAQDPSVNYFGAKSGSLEARKFLLADKVGGHLDYESGMIDIPVHVWRNKSAAAAARPETTAALASALQQKEDEVTEEQKVVGRSFQAFLNTLADKWKKSSDPEVRRRATFIDRRVMRIQILSEEITRTGGAPIGVGVLTDGADNIQLENGQIQFRWDLNTIFWGDMLRALNVSEGNQHADIAMALEAAIVKEIGGLAYMEDHPYSSASRNWCFLWLQEHCGSLDGIDRKALQDPHVRYVIQIALALTMRLETVGYVAMNSFLATNGMSSTDLDRLQNLPGITPSTRQALKGIANVRALGETASVAPGWAHAIRQIQSNLYDQVKAAAFSPDQVFLARKAVLIELIEGRAVRGEDGKVQVHQDPATHTYPIEFLSYLRDPAFSEATLVALQSRFGSVPNLKADLPPMGVEASPDDPRGLVLIAPETFWDRWGTEIESSLGGITLVTGGLYALWLRKQRVAQLEWLRQWIEQNTRGKPLTDDFFVELQNTLKRGPRAVRDRMSEHERKISLGQAERLIKGPKESNPSTAGRGEPGAGRDRGLEQPGTRETLRRWAASDNWLLRRLGSGNYREVGLSIIEDWGIVQAGRTTRLQAFMQGGLPLTISINALMVMSGTATATWLIAPLAVMLTVAGMYFMVDFVEGHGDQSWSEFRTRLMGVLFLMNAAEAIAALIPWIIWTQISGNPKSPEGWFTLTTVSTLLGMSVRFLAHRDWNRYWRPRRREGNYVLEQNPDEPEFAAASGPAGVSSREAQLEQAVNQGIAKLNKLSVGSHEHKQAFQELLGRGPLSELYDQSLDRFLAVIGSNLDRCRTPEQRMAIVILFSNVIAENPGFSLRLRPEHVPVIAKLSVDGAKSVLSRAIHVANASPSGKVLLFQNLRMGGIYPPMEKEMKDLLGNHGYPVVEIGPEQLVQLAKEPAAWGTLNDSPEFQAAKIILVRFKINSTPVLSQSNHPGHYLPEGHNLIYKNGLERLRLLSQLPILMADASPKEKSDALYKIPDDEFVNAVAHDVFDRFSRFNRAEYLLGSYGMDNIGAVLPASDLYAKDPRRTVNHDENYLLYQAGWLFPQFANEMAAQLASDTQFWHVVTAATPRSQLSEEVARAPQGTGDTREVRRPGTPWSWRIALHAYAAAGVFALIAANLIFMDTLPVLPFANVMFGSALASLFFSDLTWGFAAFPLAAHAGKRVVTFIIGVFTGVVLLIHTAIWPLIIDGLRHSRAYKESYGTFLTYVAFIPIILNALILIMRHQQIPPPDAGPKDRGGNGGSLGQQEEVPPRDSDGNTPRQLQRLAATLARAA